MSLTKKLTEKELNKLSFDEQIIYKMKVIEESKELSEIPFIYLPSVHQSKYYFVSYSHKDYKEVYKQIFELEKEGLNIWYDLGIPAGQDWLKTAEDYISPFECIGILFFVSENSLMSEAIFDEMIYCSKTSKPFIIITLPFDKDYMHNGANVKGKNFHINEMLDILLENNVKLDNEKVAVIRALFPPSLINLFSSSPASNKAKAIESNIPKESILDISVNYDQKTYTITKVRDPNVRKISKNDSEFALKKAAIGPRPIGMRFPIGSVKKPGLNNGIISGKITTTKIRQASYLSRAGLLDYYSLSTQNVNPVERNYFILNIGECAFSNCRRLETITTQIPDKIGKYSFYNCFNLKTVSFTNIDFNSSDSCEIEEGAFEHCSSLKKFEGVYIESVGLRAFHGCSSLSDIDLMFVDEIKESAFEGCSSLEKLELGSSLTKIPKNAFKDCSSLKEVKLPKELQEIESGAFAGCSSLEEIFIPKSVKTIRPNAFANSGISKIIFEESVPEIDGSAFANMYELTDIEMTNIDTKNPYSFDGVLFKDDGETLIKFPCGRLEEDFYVSDGVKKIADHAFDCCKIKKLAISNSVTEIGKEAFANSLLEEIFIPSSVEKMSHDVFVYCRRLKKIYYKGSRDSFNILTGRNNMPLIGETHHFVTFIPRETEIIFIDDDSIESQGDA